MTGLEKDFCVSEMWWRYIIVGFNSVPKKDNGASYIWNEVEDATNEVFEEIE